MNRTRGYFILVIILACLAGMYLLLRRREVPVSRQSDDAGEISSGAGSRESGGAGALLRVSPACLTAGEPVNVEITISAPKDGIAVGGKIVFPIYMKRWFGLDRGLNEDRTGNSLVFASRSDGGGLETTSVRKHPVWDILSDLKITVTGIPLPAGETITLRFGDKNNVLRRYRKKRRLIIEALLDAAGNEDYVTVPAADVEVREGPPTRLFLVAPSQASAWEPVEIVAWAEDRFRNVCEEYTGRLRIYAESDGPTARTSYLMRSWDRSQTLDRNTFTLTFPAPGIYYIRAEDPVSGLAAVSNPVRVTDGPPGEMLAWGEIHVHSQISDGAGELSDIYREGYARGLDFVAITDHGFGRNARGSLTERLVHLCGEADRFHRDGKYITIPAGEMHWFPRTHMNIYFPENDPGRIESVLTRLNNLPWPGQWDSLTSEELTKAGDRFWDTLAMPKTDLPILCFTHHTMWQGMTEFVYDDRMRVIEIHSIQGCSETRDTNEIPSSLRMRQQFRGMNPTTNFSVREVLNSGCRLGFVGGSDNHDGRPGDNALTAVRVPELTRQALFQALADRRCYATSANRTLIEFKVNGAGSEKTREASPLTFFCSVAGDGPIDTVEIIGNGRTVHQYDPKGQRIAEFNWSPTPAEPGYYYLRAFLNNGQDGAWSSPIWIEKLPGTRGGELTWRR